ncbi:MAG TPA: protein phosphatase CheZ [Burkholderiaceae bacterium]|nr:protein phosphatase CheZ [Burkholderiaceae bacterium]
MTTPSQTGEGPDLYQRLGELTRTLHDALRELGYDRELQTAVDSLPDARARLGYIARLTGEAAERVLNTVDRAKAEQDALVELATDLASNIKRDPVAAVATGKAMVFVEAVQDTSTRMNTHLTEIMMAQDFHDLTGQVIRKIVDVATKLEEQLLALLIQATPPDQRTKAEQAWLNGPVVDATQRTDVVTDQSQVDDLLESLGF